MPVINVRDQKRALRAKYRKLRETCPPDVWQRLDRKLTENFLNLDEYKQCQTLYTFISGDIECDTRHIINQAFADGKRVAVPRCVNRFGAMDFYYIKSFDDVAKGDIFNVDEPDPALCEKVERFDSGLCIVPGLCFDLQHYRVGFGKGYYDRFLDKFKGVSVGICFSKYIVNELPRGGFDKQTDILVTEKFMNRLAR